MKQMEIKTRIDLNNPLHIEALNAFIGVINSEGKTATETVKEEEVIEKPKTSTEKKKTSKKKKDSGMDIVELRKLVSEKATDHRQEIREKLSELGATNVSSLDAEHFETLANFLKEL